MSMALLKAFERRISDEQARIDSTLGRGGAADWTAYKASVAERKAFGRALDIAREIQAELAEREEVGA